MMLCPRYPGDDDAPIGAGAILTHLLPLALDAGIADMPRLA
jgi:hypothetical protein